MKQGERSMIIRVLVPQPAPINITPQVAADYRRLVNKRVSSCAASAKRIAISMDLGRGILRLRTRSAQNWPLGTGLSDAAAIVLSIVSPTLLQRSK
jgi:hypothetical protein